LLFSGRAGVTQCRHLGCVKAVGVRWDHGIEMRLAASARDRHWFSDTFSAHAVRILKTTPAWRCSPSPAVLMIPHHVRSKLEYWRVPVTEEGWRPTTATSSSIEYRAPGIAVDSGHPGCASGNATSVHGYLTRHRRRSFEHAAGARIAHATAPSKLRVGHWGLAGIWNVGRESAILEEAGGRIVYHFHARDLHMVMGPARAGSPVRFRVRIGGGPPGEAHGTDVDDQGDGTMTEARLYQLIRQPAPVRDREFEIELLDPGAEIFSFTFG
jgi:hypothetical protein